jgi:Icc-related predicted phosphoesterase
MWFPKWSPLLDYQASQFSDFEEIQDFNPWVVEENKKFSTFLRNNLMEGDVVITHYLPSQKSVSPRFKGSQTNAFFVSEMDELIDEKKPALWVHGHTHDSADYQLSNTRIVCNPFGYPRVLNSDYVEKLLIPIA